MNPLIVTPLSETIAANGNPDTLILQEISPFFGLSYENLFLIIGGVVIAGMAFKWSKKRGKSKNGEIYL